LSTADFFASIAGGIRVGEPAAHLAVALAHASVERDTSLVPRVAVFGEVSLTGELRSCSQSERRVVEAGRAGLGRVPEPATDARRFGGSVALGVAFVRDALVHVLRGTTPRPIAEALNDDGGFENVVRSR
jgi:DNA repair protein RadA/Sms